MKLDRLGIALIVAFALGGAVYVHGLEHTAYAAFLFLIGIWTYMSIVRNLK